MSKQILFVSRLFGVITYAYSIYWQNVNHNPLIHKAWGKLKYLTFWNLCLQFGFFTILFFSQSIFKICSKSFTKFLDLFFYSLAFPISVIVAGTFWGIYSIDRELIFPLIIEKYYPIWLNHSTHTLVVVLTVIELVLGGHRTSSNKSGLTILFTFLTIYLSCLLYIFFQYNHWVYPFLDVLNWPQRVIFFIFSIISNIGAYFIGIFIGKNQSSGSSSLSQSSKISKQQKQQKQKAKKK